MSAKSIQKPSDEQFPDLSMSLGEAINSDLDLNRGIYRQEEGNANFSGILLGALAVPVVVYLLYMVQGMAGH